VIVAIGIDVDDTFSRFVARALDADVPLRVVNLRAAISGDWRFDVPARAPATLHQGGEPVEIRPDDAFCCRIIDLGSNQSDDASVRRWQALLGGLRAWLDGLPGRVVNRSHVGLHNGSKPLYETLLRDLGFRVPESLTSCDADELRRFVRECPAISKTVCGVRADTATATEADLEDFQPESGPVHLQRFVPGDDARVHVVGDRVIAQRAPAGAVDYRRGGSLDKMQLFDAPAAPRDPLVEANRALGLELAGWDFKIENNESWWCLEANPMPGFSPTICFATARFPARSCATWGPSCQTHERRRPAAQPARPARRHRMCGDPGPGNRTEGPLDAAVDGPLLHARRGLLPRRGGGAHRLPRGREGHKSVAPRIVRVAV
jgi:hypothetical protein